MLLLLELLEPGWGMLEGLRRVEDVEGRFDDRDCD